MRDHNTQLWTPSQILVKLTPEVGIGPKNFPRRTVLDFFGRKIA